MISVISSFNSPLSFQLSLPFTTNTPLLLNTLPVLNQQARARGQGSVHDLRVVARHQRHHLLLSVELRNDPTPHSRASRPLASTRVVHGERADVEARHAHRLRVARTQQCDQLLQVLEVLELERAHVLLPEVVRVARAPAQHARLQLAHVQVERGEHVVVGVQHVDHHLQRLADVLVLEHALVQQVQLADRAAGDQLLRQLRVLDQVLHDRHHHADDLLAVVRVQAARDLRHQVVLLHAEQRGRLGHEGEEPDAQQQQVHELHRVAHAQVEQAAQSTCHAIWGTPTI